MVSCMEYFDCTWSAWKEVLTLRKTSMEPEKGCWIDSCPLKAASLQVSCQYSGECGSYFSPKSRPHVAGRAEQTALCLMKPFKDSLQVSDLEHGLEI